MGRHTVVSALSLGLLLVCLAHVHAQDAPAPASSDPATSSAAAGAGKPLPALLQPVVSEAKPVPLGTPEKAVALLREMNQKWEGMEHPNSANNPWESVSSHGTGAGTFDGPSTKIGTQEDPYTPRFGTWKHPPRATPPPMMYKTFLFDPEHPFRRNLQQPPEPSQKAPDASTWHPLQGLRFRDTSKYPQVVLPVPRRRVTSNVVDKYGVPGRRPSDWQYERVPVPPRVVTPEVIPRLPSATETNALRFSYPKFSVLNPQSVFTRHFPTAKGVKRGSFLETEAEAHVERPVVSAVKKDLSHFGPVPPDVIRPPSHAAPAAPAADSAPAPALLETTSRARRRNLIRQRAGQKHQATTEAGTADQVTLDLAAAVKRLAALDKQRAHDKAQRKAETAAARPFNIDPNELTADQNSASHFRFSTAQQKAQTTAKATSTSQAKAESKAKVDAKSKAKNDDVDPTNISLDGPSDPDGILATVADNKRTAAPPASPSAKAANVASAKPVASESKEPQFIAIQETEGMTANNGLLRVRHIEPPKAAASSSTGALMEVSAQSKTAALAQMAATDRAQARAMLTMDKEEDMDRETHLASTAAHPPVLMQYELALTPDPSVHATAPNNVPVPPPHLLAAKPVIFENSVSGKRHRKQKTDPILTEVASEVKDEDAPLDLATVHKQQVEQREKEQKEQDEKAWLASPDSKVPWWERGQSLLENDERVKNAADVTGVVKNPLAPKDVDLPLAVDREDPSHAGTNDQSYRFASVPFPANDIKTPEAGPPQLAATQPAHSFTHTRTELSAAGEVQQSLQLQNVPAVGPTAPQVPSFTEIGSTTRHENQAAVGIRAQTGAAASIQGGVVADSTTMFGLTTGLANPAGNAYGPPDLATYSHDAAPPAPQQESNGLPPNSPSLVPFLPPGSNPNAPPLERPLTDTLRSLQQQEIPMFVQSMDRAVPAPAPQLSNVNNAFMLPNPAGQFQNVPPQPSQQVPNVNPFAALRQALVEQHSAVRASAPSPSLLLPQNPMPFAPQQAGGFIPQQQQQPYAANPYAFAQPSTLQFQQQPQQQYPSLIEQTTKAAPTPAHSSSSDFIIRQHPNLPPIVLA